MFTYARRPTYVPFTLTLSPVQLLVTLTYVHVATLRCGHPSTHPLYYVPNTIGPRVELTVHQAWLWIGHRVATRKVYLTTITLDRWSLVAALAGWREAMEDRDRGAMVVGSPL